MSDAKGSSTMRSLERAITVLEVLEATRSPLRLSEVARQADLHVATTQRILNVLESHGRVEQTAAGYTTGVTMLFGAHAYLSTNQVALAAPMVLQQLASSTGLTASVFVRAGRSRAVVSRVEGDDPLRYVLPIGERLPLHLGAGKALLAFMEDDDLDDILAELDAVSRADGTSVGLAEFRAELDDVRRRGWVGSRDERVIGAASVGAPVLAGSGECVAAVQVAGPSHNPAFDNLDELALEVRQAAVALGSRFPAASGSRRGRRQP